MAQAVGVEARAKHNEYNKQGNYGDHTGCDLFCPSICFAQLSCFAPVINIMRHPLWGRNQVQRELLNLLSKEVPEACLKITLPEKVQDCVLFWSELRFCEIELKMICSNK